MNDSHNLNFYLALARKVSAMVEADLGIALKPRDITDISDAIYRAVLNAKVHPAALKEPQ